MSSVTRYLDKYYHKLSCTCECSETCFHLLEQTQGPSERLIRLQEECLSYCWLNMCLNQIAIVCPYRRGRNLAFAVLIIQISVLEGLLFSLIKWQIQIKFRDVDLETNKQSYNQTKTSRCSF